MDIKQHFIKLAQFMITTVKFIAVFYFFLVTAFAEEYQGQFKKIAQLNHVQSATSGWSQLISHPNNNKQFFIINKAGQVFFVEDMKNLKPVLDLNVNYSKESSSIQLTAIELHPNFALRYQLGSRTFYTAHLEVLDKKSRTKRIQEDGSEITLKFDNVITEWQFSSLNYQEVDLSTKREVLRISVPDNTMVITQMSFSPHTKSWNDGFGLLYIALNGQAKWQKPLYSGVLLRINPAKFGLKNFTVPNDNPYLKDDKIKDEIYLLGGQNIKQFMWPDKGSDDILLSHRYKSNSLLSFTNGQNDWRDSEPKEIIYQRDTFIESALLYRGSNRPYLRNKLLLMTKNNQKWFIESLNITPSVNKNILLENQPKQEWQITSQQLSSNSEITLSNDKDGEVLVLDKMSGIIFQLPQGSSSKKTFVNENVITPEIQIEPMNKIYIIFIVMIVIGVVFYIFKRNKYSVKAQVRKQFAHLELSESQQQIGLYHRHQKSPEAIINITDIVSCEVKLNNQIINLINEKAGYGFNDAKEKTLRNYFTKERVGKMVDDKVRQICLLVTDINNKTYTVCLYMRKGSARVTKKAYLVVIDDLIDWCWLIATKINPAETENRRIKATISSESAIDLVEQRRNRGPLYDQAEIIIPVNTEASKTEQSAERDLADKQYEVMEANEIIEFSSQVDQNNTIDTGLVNALERLVNLKQQGFLTQEEFSKAKENLLRNLFDK